jgi:hypothetical protein
LLCCCFFKLNFSLLKPNNSLIMQWPSGLANFKQSSLWSRESNGSTDGSQCVNVLGDNGMSLFRAILFHSKDH